MAEVNPQNKTSERSDQEKEEAGSRDSKGKKERKERKEKNILYDSSLKRSKFRKDKKITKTRKWHSTPRSSQACTPSRGRKKKETRQTIKRLRKDH